MALRKTRAQNAAGIGVAIVAGRGLKPVPSVEPGSQTAAEDDVAGPIRIKCGNSLAVALR